MQKTQSSSLLRDLFTPVLCAERLLLQLWPTSKLLESREQFWPFAIKLRTLAFRVVVE